MVESRSIVIGSSARAAPIDQARRIDSAITASSWRMCPKVKARKKVPSVDGAMTRNGRTLRVAPARRRSTWSMWVAPVRIAATNVSTFAPDVPRQRDHPGAPSGSPAPRARGAP